MRRFALLAVFATLYLPQTATAKQPPLVPPGVSGANQYTETLPGPGGNEPTSGSGSGGHNPKSTSKALGKGNAQRLESLGPEGQAVAELAASGAGGATPHHGKAGVADRKSLGSAGGGSGGVGQVLDNLSGTDDGEEGMGILLPGLIVIFVIAAGTFVIARHRARTQS